MIYRLGSRAKYTRQVEMDRYAACIERVGGCGFRTSQFNSEANRLQQLQALIPAVLE
jgi:hypothetical protein